MSARTHLSDRYQHILKATIQHYIATAEPVGSKTLLDEYKLLLVPPRFAMLSVNWKKKVYSINPTLPPDAFPPIGVIVSTSMS